MLPILPPAHIPAWAIKLALALTITLAAFAYGYHKGSARIQAAWDQEKAAQALAAQTEATRTASVAVKTVTRYIDRVRLVQGRTKTITTEVPIYVPVEADADCTVNRGFVRLHNAAAAGDALPEPAGAADAAPAGLALSALAGIVVENYGACHQTAEQLTALQDWVREVGQ